MVYQQSISLSKPSFSFFGQERDSDFDASDILLKNRGAYRGLKSYLAYLFVFSLLQLTNSFYREQWQGYVEKINLFVEGMKQAIKYQNTA